MDTRALDLLLADVAAGVVTADEARAVISRLPFNDLGFARVDHHRPLRHGHPEAVYGPGKDPAHCAEIVVDLLDREARPVLVTRASAAQVDAVQNATARYHDELVITATGDTSLLAFGSGEARVGNVIVVTAGTADLPVAAEATATLRALGFDVTALSDCGVAGIHRILGEASVLQRADAIVVVAGMEGALASVVGGITGAPIVAVPTSVGYGSSFEGITALLAMVSSCASGIAVVGIDNGFGAASCVHRWLA